VAELLLIKKTD